MGERTEYAPGTFSWIDLSTTDPEAAKAFYGGLFGWEGEDLPAGEDGVYTMLRKDGRDVAGLAAQPEFQREAGVPPAWQSYVTVADVDATASRVSELGGQVLMGPMDVMEAGRMAVILGPEGAALMLWQPRRHPGAGVVNEPGTLTWNDLVTPDVEASAAFYRELFGWKIEPLGDGEYWSIVNNGAPNGGMVPMSGPPPYWNVYFATEDLDAVVAAAEQGGGGVLVPAQAVPAGRFVIMRDPQGAAFALFEGEEFDD